MRMFLFLAISVVVIGCADNPQGQTEKPQEQTYREVLQWLSKVPHLKIWGVSHLESEDELRRRRNFNFDSWIAAGKKIPHIESVLRGMLEQNYTKVDVILQQGAPIICLDRVAYALGRVGNAESVPVLIDCLNSPDSNLQMQAMLALGCLRDPRAVDPLGTRLMIVTEYDEGYMSFLLSALEEIGDENSKEYLKRAAKGVDSYTKEMLSNEQQNVDERKEGN